MNLQGAFPCYRCGACCRHVNMAAETHFLDRGDGVCRYFDDTVNLCSIYEDRPDICRVDRQYQLHYMHYYTWEQFVAVNLNSCQLIESLAAPDRGGPDNFDVHVKPLLLRG